MHDPKIQRSLDLGFRGLGLGVQGLGFGVDPEFPRNLDFYAEDELEPLWNAFA